MAKRAVESSRQLPWMKWYPTSWMSDPCLRSCSPATRGIWADLCCAMWMVQSGTLVRTEQQLSRLCGISRMETLTALRDLHITGTANIEPALSSVAPPEDALFSITSRKVSRDMASLEAHRKEWRKRKNKQKSACGQFTLPSHDLPTESPPLEVRDQRLDQDPPVVPLSGDRPRKSKRKAEPHPDATLALAELNAARKRVNARARDLSNLPVNLRYLTERLADGATLEDLRHVIAVREAECRRTPDAFRWFDAITPFRPDSFARAIAADPALRVVERGEPQRAEPLPFNEVFSGYKDDLR